MKTRSLLSLAIGITIITIAYSPVLAEVDRTIQQLADGDYFYGETPTPNQAEAGYLVFRKTGSNIAGLFYQQGTNLSFCFQGTTKPNSTKSVTKRQLEDGSRAKESLLSDFPSLGGLFKLGFEQLPALEAKSFAQCLR